MFGWRFDRFPGAPDYYGMATTGDTAPGINGGFFQRREGAGISLTMEVGSIEDATQTIEAEGGKVVQGKTPIPGLGWFATCKDTEGNTFGLFTNDPGAS